jgi:hypothetical protein
VLPRGHGAITRSVNDQLDLGNCHPVVCPGANPRTARPASDARQGGQHSSYAERLLSVSPSMNVPLGLDDSVPPAGPLSRDSGVGRPPQDHAPATVADLFRRHHLDLVRSLRPYLTQRPQGESPKIASCCSWTSYDLFITSSLRHAGAVGTHPGDLHTGVHQGPMASDREHGRSHSIGAIGSWVARQVSACVCALTATWRRGALIALTGVPESS